MLLISKRKLRSAFTIIELLVAATVTLVLVGLMLQITVQTLGIWNQTSGKLGASNQGKAVLDYLEEDFQGLVLKYGATILATIEDPDAAPFNSAAMADAKWNTGGVTGGRVKPAGANNAGTDANDSSDFQTQITAESRRDIAEYRFGQAGVWLRMITNERSPNGTASLRAVGYQVVRISPTDENTGGSDGATVVRRYQLYRSSVTAQITFNAAYSLGYDSDGTTPAAYNIPSGTSGAAGNISRPNRSFLLANNVVDFGVRLWGRGSNNNLALLFPKTATNRGFSGPNSTPLDPPSPSGLGAAVMTGGVPVAADIFVRVLTDEGARLLENFEYGRTDREVGYSSDDEYWWALVLKHSHVLTRRVTVASTVN